MKRSLAIALATLAFCVASVGANGGTQRDSRLADLQNPAQVGRVVIPSLRLFWQRKFAQWGYSYRIDSGAWWYDRPGLRGWYQLPKGCDTYKKRDGWMWKGVDGWYQKYPNSYYCPLSEEIYLDYDWMQTLGFTVTRKWGRGDDARVALVMAHEYGHHVQHLLQWPEAKRRQRQFANYELHADCLAGVWFAYGEDVGIIERADTLNANTFLGYLGDADKTPWREPTAHGGHSDRQEWFTYGYQYASASDCGRVFR